MNWVSFGAQAVMSLSQFAVKAAGDGEIRLSELGRTIGGVMEDLGIGVNYDVNQGEFEAEIQAGQKERQQTKGQQ